MKQSLLVASLLAVIGRQLPGSRRVLSEPLDGVLRIVNDWAYRHPEWAAKVVNADVADALESMEAAQIRFVVRDGLPYVEVTARQAWSPKQVLEMGERLQACSRMPLLFVELRTAEVVFLADFDEELYREGDLGTPLRTLRSKWALQPAA